MVDLFRANLVLFVVLIVFLVVAFFIFMTRRGRERNAKMRAELLVKEGELKKAKEEFESKYDEFKKDFQGKKAEIEKKFGKINEAGSKEEEE